MLGMPMIGNVGFEVWRTKEANASAADFPAWGEQETRGILWEATTAMALLQAGIDVVVMRHPKAATLIKQNIEELMVKTSFDE